MARQTIRIGGARKGDALILPNPVLIAAGMGGGAELHRLIAMTRLGGFVTPAITRQPRPGIRAPRFMESAAGLVCALPFPTLGLRAALRQHAPVWRRWGVPVIANVPGDDVPECQAVLATLDAEALVTAAELDLTPLGRHPGAPPLDGAGVRGAVSAVAAASPLPLLVKLPPDARSLRLLARTAVEAGADALTIGGGVGALLLDPRSGDRPRLDAPAVLTGPATLPLVLRAVAEVADVVSLPVIASGGVACGVDALALLRAGACAVQVGSALFRDPIAPARVLDELAVLSGTREGPPSPVEAEAALGHEGEGC
jgi:dihydroorotate dehydrogenase (NAD+) catalytic subunit